MKTRLNILAIDPGLREMGIAHLENDEIIDYGVKSLRRPNQNPLNVLNRIFTRLIKEKKPTIIAMEKNNFSRIEQNLQLMKAIQRIRQIARSHNISLYEFAPSTIKKEVCNDGRATKKQIAMVICSRYPELSVFLESNRRWRERYYQNMFDAIACGITYLKMHKRNESNEYKIEK